MSETKTKNLCTVPAADLTDNQYFIAEDGGELKRIPKAQVVLKKLEKMLATDTENLAGGGEVTAQELLDALAEQVANKLLAKSQVVNNLLATVEGNPLDATQGKALKALIDTTNNNLSKSRETVRTPTNITTGTNILKLDPGIYSYEDSNASDEQKLAMGFPKAMWHAEITVTGYWADNNKSTGYINIVVRDCNGDTPCIYENLYGWTGWRGWQSYALKGDSLRFSRTYISGDSYADAKNLSIPPGIYSVGPDYKNIPETTYGFLEIVADSINNWRLIKFIPTNIKSYYLMFYNGYDKTWSGWAHFTSVS